MGVDVGFGAGIAVAAGEDIVVVPRDLVAALDRVAGSLAVTPEAILLAAHATVAGALSGERELVVGVPASDQVIAAYAVSLGEGTWADVIRGADVVLAHGGTPVDAALPPTLLDLMGAFGPRSAPSAGVTFVTTVERSGETLALRVLPDNEGRIAGYLLSALGLIAADVTAPHGTGGLLSPAERDFQLTGLAGPTIALPDRRFHELFQERARLCPDDEAARQGDRSWTYGELNRRANRLARALVARGVEAEDVVAVVLERGLDWLATVLAVFKSGGAYLPIEPHFPAARILSTLDRSGCRIVVTEPGSQSTLDAALADRPATQVLTIPDGYAEEHRDDDLDRPVRADQLAYIYFTSGSTGEPKGAMCEHEGLLNHLLAKVEDLGIGPAQTVAQTAPQCFDISLWQLVAGLLVGARTVIVPQADILDVDRYLDTIVRERVEVLQVVPSYLEVVLARLRERPVDLGRLRCVSVTGEALKKELVQRWFAAYPRIALVNAYGLTETSDDTNHELMTGVPAGDRVPLGRPIRNVQIYVVDEHLEPVPFGAPGEIVFSGMCVGRGYINDPERTRQAFLADPHRPGARAYRSGDYGRWLPDGRLEFLGRRDAQVKIRGFRVEIGEIENQLLRVPGVRDAAVVVVRGSDVDAQLIGFYSTDTASSASTDGGDKPAANAPTAASVTARLAEALPDYMVPARLHRMPSLPLTGNGKIDKKHLAAWAAEAVTSADSAEVEPPRTPTERRLAEAWAAVLRRPVERVGRYDDFFASGGTSLSGVRLIVHLDRLFTLTDLVVCPILADLAHLVDSGQAGLATSA